MCRSRSLPHRRRPKGRYTYDILKIFGFLDTPPPSSLCLKCVLKIRKIGGFMTPTHPPFNMDVICVCPRSTTTTISPRFVNDDCAAAADAAPFNGGCSFFVCRGTIKKRIFGRHAFRSRRSSQTTSSGLARSVLYVVEFTSFRQ